MIYVSHFSSHLESLPICFFFWHAQITYLSLSLSMSPSLCLSLPLSLSLSLSIFLPLSLSIFHSLNLYPFLYHSLSLSLCLPVSVSLSDTCIKVNDCPNGRTPGPEAPIGGACKFCLTGSYSGCAPFGVGQQGNSQNILVKM